MYCCFQTVKQRNFLKQLIFCMKILKLEDDSNGDVDIDKN